MTEWISVEERLPNEDEIYYDGVSFGDRHISDRVLAIDAEGFIRTGYFMSSCLKHKYHGNRVRSKYSDWTFASWEFGENYGAKKENWVCSYDSSISSNITHWMPLPKPYKAEEGADE